MSTMTGKVCVVTGATNGIGRATAMGLASMGATVIGIGRNAAKCAATAEEIRTTTDDPDVTFLVADLSRQADVRRVGQEILDGWERVDVLVNNAGGYFAQRQESPDGIELTWALNHLAYFLLTEQLRDHLIASAPARVVNLSSEAERRGKIRLEDPGLSAGFNGWAAYSQSKLANLLFTNELARRLDGLGVTANAVHPGLVSSGFGKNNGGAWGIIIRLASKLGRSPEKGAETVLYLATSPKVAAISGRYFADKKPIEPAPAAHDTELAAQLWELSKAMTRPPVPA